MADTLRSGLFAKEPALAVLTVGELQQDNTPDNNRQLQQQIAGGFNTTRESIGKLEKGLQNDKDGLLFHRELKQLTGVEACQCRKTRIQRNQIACALLVWSRLKTIADRSMTFAYFATARCD